MRDRARAGVWGYACAWRKLHRGAWAGFDARGALARERVRAFAAQALPAAVAPALEQAQFVLVTTWCGKLGTDALAAHAAMLDLFMFATAGMYGFCDSCSARVGAALGAGRRARAHGVPATLLSMVAMGALVDALFARAPRSATSSRPTRRCGGTRGRWRRSPAGST